MSKNKKRIGIMLDGTIRNLGSKVAVTFARRFPEREFDGVVDQFKPFVNLPLEQNEFIEFICDSALEIYGKAEYCYPNAVRDLNQLVQTLEPEGYEVVLLSREYFKVRPATLFFLSEAGCEVSNIRFIKIPVMAWLECDILVTGNIEMMNHKPKDKDLIILLGEENLNLETKHKTVATLRDVITVIEPDAFAAAIPEGTVEVQEEITEENLQQKLDEIKSDY